MTNLIYRAHPCDCGCPGYIGPLFLRSVCLECTHDWTDHFAQRGSVPVHTPPIKPTVVGAVGVQV